IHRRYLDKKTCSVWIPADLKNADVPPHLTRLNKAQTHGKANSLSFMSPFSGGNAASIFASWPSSTRPISDSQRSTIADQLYSFWTKILPLLPRSDRKSD